MKILAADTSTSSGSICLMEKGRVRTEWTLHSEITHNRFLLKTIDQTLREAGWDMEAVDALAVTTGPGSFTGLRIGLTTMKTLAWTLGKPFVGISSLDALASQLPFARHPVCSMLDARKNEVFFGFYTSSDVGDLVRNGELRVAPPEILPDLIREPTIFCGDGWLAHQELLRKELGPKALDAGAPHHILRASLVAHLAHKRILAGDLDDPVTCVPLYIRPSEAELHYPELSTHISQAAHPVK